MRLLVIVRGAGKVAVGNRVLSGRHSNLFELIQGRLGSIALKQNVLLDPPGSDSEELVFAERADWHGKDPVELFQSTLHGFRDPEKDHDKRNNVEASVEAESSDGMETSQQERECNTQDSGLN